MMGPETAPRVGAVVVRRVGARYLFRQDGRAWLGGTTDAPTCYPAAIAASMLRLSGRQVSRSDWRAVYRFARLARSRRSDHPTAGGAGLLGWVLATIGTPRRGSRWTRPLAVLRRHEESLDGRSELCCPGCDGGLHQ